MARESLATRLFLSLSLIATRVCLLGLTLMGCARGSGVEFFRVDQSSLSPLGLNLGLLLVGVWAAVKNSHLS